MPPGFDRFENFVHDELTAKHCYFRCSRPPDVDGIKIFDKDDHAGCKTLFIVLCTKFEGNWPSSSRDVLLKIDPFSSHFSSSHRFTKVTLKGAAYT